MQRGPRLLEVGERLPIGRALKRPGPGLPAIADRFVPQGPAQRMVGKALHLFIQAVRVELLDRGHNLRVKLAVPVAEQAAVGHLMGECMLEGVLQVREELRLVDELGFLQMGKPAS